MSQEIYCPAGHSYNKNKYINTSTGICDSCIKEHFIQEVALKEINDSRHDISKFLKESNDTYDIDSKESQECFDWEKEIQNKVEKTPFTLGCNSRKSKECINLDNEDNITPKKIKKIKKD
ncbi:4513_t:CDS:2 [Diversispora eburnea]|uniref:4513_t:CDS:1 n=1 Tax=Diversispora eburnea TaxID=1213867 RepID=A0A9N9CWR7_9GLOM|nr:4513_t:CDS:2 [Diversispora eburnea]